ncbi:MAG TPA: M48 family metallopeptidase [Candidatus Cybelea sp.]|jgi:STE24 endopeptidase|nr:M48 family metallopeptidase [Candidatus Cybelea sp.]
MALSLGKLLAGAGIGLSAGYVAVRLCEAWQQWRVPTDSVSKGARAYSGIRRALDVAETVRSTAGFAAFAYAPIAARADDATSTIPPWLRPAAYFAAFSLASSAFELPVAFVEGYALEGRFGLSDQTRADWLADYAKSSLISTGFSALLATLFGFVLRRAPRAWPFWASAGAFPLFVIGNVIVPLYIMPLFNKFEPVTGSLETRLRALATRFGVGDASILRMDMSRQTRKANAFVTGIGRTHRIVLGDTLVEAFPESEIEFVVAHELGHYVNKDTWRLIGLGELLAIALFAIAARGISEPELTSLRDRPLLIVRLYALMLVATQVLRPLLFAFSRSREWAADRFAIAATGDALGGAAAFRRLRDQNLTDEDPPGWYELFFASHPSLRERIAALETAKESP